MTLRRTTPTPDARAGAALDANALDVVANDRLDVAPLVPGDGPPVAAAPAGPAGFLAGLVDRAQRALKRGSVVAVLASVLLVAACGGGAGGESDDPPHSSAESQTTDAPTAVTEENVDIGGRKLYMRCWGERVADEPTVLLLAGSGPTTSSWEPLAIDLARDRHHLCAYDRLGVGGSAAVLEAPRATKDQVDDLVALLDAADLQEPVVVVAHSLGSYPAVGLVDRAPERVAGVVLIDPRSPRVSAAARAALPPKKPNESAELAEERRNLNDYL